MAVAEKRSGKHILEANGAGRGAGSTTGSTEGSTTDNSEKGTNKAETEGVGVKRPIPDRWDVMTTKQRKDWRKRHWR